MTVIRDITSIWPARLLSCGIRRRGRRFSTPKGNAMGSTSPSTAGEQATSNAGPPPLAPMGAVLGVKDIERASRFYQALGFQQQFALPRADGQLTLAVLSYGSSTLLLGRLDELHYEHEARAKRIRRGPHGLGVTLTLLVSDL